MLTRWYSIYLLLYVVNWLLFYIQNCLYMLTCWYILIVVLGWGWGSAPCELQQFLQFLKILKVRTHGWMQNWFLLHIKKSFSMFWACLAYKFSKSANMTPKKFFPNIFNMGIKKRRIWCRLRIRWKSIKKVFTKKVRGLRTFVHSTKRWKTLLC